MSSGLSEIAKQEAQSLSMLLAKKQQSSTQETSSQIQEEPKPLESEETQESLEQDNQTPQAIPSEEKQEQNTQEIDQEEQEAIKKQRSSILFDRAKQVLVGKENLRSQSKIDSIHQDVADLGSVFALERKLFDLVVRLLFMMIALFIALLIAFIFVFPLKEKEPYLVTFANDTQNFAIVQKADDTITANEALNRQLIGAYIINRETINQIDDKERREIVREQSSVKVWKTFENIVSQNESIYTNSNLSREVKIINISIISKSNSSIAAADIDVKLFYQGVLQSQKRYRVTIAYKFVGVNIIDYASMPKNPTGFKVTNYAITEIATIKELPKENQVLQSSGSKIQYKNKEVKQDDYSFATPSIVAQEKPKPEEKKQ